MALKLPLSIGAALCLLTSPAMLAYSPQSANSPLFYGYHLNSAYDEAILANGMYTFNVGPGSDTSSLSAFQNMETPSAAAYHDGKYYVVKVESNWLTGDKATLYIYDMKDGSQISSVKLAQTLGSSFTVSADGSRLYAIFANWEGTGIKAFDTITGAIEDVAEIPASLYYTDICADDQGNIYTFNTTDYKLYRTVMSSGETSEVFQLDNVGDRRSASYFDTASGLIYHTAADEDGVKHMYAINPTAKTQKDLGMTPDGLSAIGIGLPTYDSTLPQAVTDVAFRYAAPGASNAILTFTMPSTSVGGEALIGQIDAIVVLDGIEETLAATAGKPVTVNKTLTNGNHTFSIFASNAAGRSPERRFTSFCGQDLPCEVQDLTLAIDENGVATVTWSEPVKTQNGGEIDRESLAYTVIREPHAVTVAQGLKATTFSETLTDAFANYYYRVIPTVSNGNGTEARTEAVKWGTVDVPPFTEDFEFWEDFDRFTAISANEDGYGWSNGSGNTYCVANANTDADYWLFTPAMRLVEGETYTLSFDTNIEAYSYATGNMELYFSDSPETETAEQLMSFTVPNGNHKFYKEFKAPANGTFHLAFRNVSSAGGPQIQMDNISVIPNATAQAPAAVSDLKAEAAPAGALSATVTFTLPAQGVDEVKVVNLTNGKTLEAGAPSQQMTVSDNAPAEGFNNYEAYTVSGGVKGVSTFARVFVGTDMPAAVTSFKAAQSPVGSAVLTWDKASNIGANGGYVDPTTVTYTIRRYDDINGYYAPEIATGVDACTYTDNTATVPEDSQCLVKYVITPEYNGETTPQSSVILTLGTPYALPFVESMTDATFKNSGWSLVSHKGAAEWDVDNGEATAFKPYDADGGMLLFRNGSTFEANADFRTPRITLGNLKSAALSLFMLHGYDAEPEDVTLTLTATADDGEPVTLGTISYNDGTQGWQRHSFDLSQFAANDNIYLDLLAYAADGSAPIVLDNFRVAETFQADVELSGITIPAAIQAGENKAVVDVTNLGLTEATFTVILNKDGEAVARQEVTGLAPGKSQHLSMDMGVSIADAGKTLEYNAVAEMDTDMFTDNNNSDTATTFVKINTLPVVELEGEVNDNTVDITWSKPEPRMTAPLTDGFEDYSAYALNNFGDWITYDADGKETDFSKFWPQITNAKAPMAFEVWDVAQVEKDGFFSGLVDKDPYMPHTGDKALITFTAVDNDWFGEFPAANDNWLISPVVTGGTDLEFYIRSLQSSNPETIEVLYTEEESIDAAAPAVDSFRLIDKFSIQDKDWRSIKVTLPLEARRFAIRHTTEKNGFQIMIDDVTYTPAQGNEKAIEPKGYNVYRDNVLVATVNEEAFDEHLSDKGVYVYHVTTLWDAGESMISNPFYAEIEKDDSAVESAGSDSVEILTGAGFIEIRTPQSIAVRVNEVSGVTVFNDNVNGNAHVAATPGMYIVTVGTCSQKVIVR